jgi:CelD/BcsL family acetyltransferase involved in cellulose biosynthesis
MTHDLRCEIMEDADALAVVAPAWWALWRRCPAATPFTSPAWALPWWQAFSPGRLRAAVIWDSDALVALAPIYLEEGELGRRLLPIGIGISDALDVLVDPRMQDAAGSTLVQSVAAHAADWDSWELEELPPGAAALALPVPLGCMEEGADQSASPVLDLSAQADPFLVLPARKRRKLRMAQNRVARRGGEVRAVGTREVGAFLDDLTRLHGARWSSRGEDGVLADDPVHRFHALALPELVETGLARLFTLTIEGRVVGAYYGLQHGGRAYAYLGGFDPDFAFESPGTVLIGHAIADAAASGATVFDFLRGQEPYKYEWGAVDHWSRRRSFRRLDRA